MAEQLTVFKNIKDQVVTDPISTINVITNLETEQAILSNIKVKASDPLYECSVTLNMGNTQILEEENKGDVGEIVSIDASGKQIVDKSSTVDVIIDTTSFDRYYIVPSVELYFQSKMDAMVFSNGLTNPVSIKDTSTDNRPNPTAIPYTDIVPDIVSTSLFNGGASHAYSAFGWIDDRIEDFIIEDIPKRYSRCYNSIIYTHNSLGALIQTSTSFSTTPVYGACTDEIYFYGKSSSANNILQRINIIDGSVASPITMSESFAGQALNSGAYLLYFDGYVYSKQYGSSTTVYKVNVVTGEVTTLEIPSGSSYSAGALITIAANGTPYLVEHCSANTFVIDLNTFTLVPISWATGDTLGISTEYGNLALEVSVGVVAFFYNTVHLFFDVNTMTRSGNITNTTSNFPTTFSTSYSSIANFPLYDHKKFEISAREITYSLYADGVKIIGV